MSTPAHRAPKIVTPRKAAAVAVVGLSAGTVVMLPSSSQAETLSQAKAQYQQDIGQAEAAGQDYDQQQQAYEQLQQKIDALQNQISEQNQQISTLSKAIGDQAAQQYRNGGVSSTLQLTLSSSPGAFLDKAAGQNEMAVQEAEQLKNMTTAQAQMRQEQALATTLLAQQRQALAAAQTAKARAEQITNEAKQVIDSLTPSQQQQVSIGSSAQQQVSIGSSSRGGYWTHFTGSLPVATGRAAAVVAYAESKVGDSYVWGATGPNEFDCSGLNVESWAAAGVSIPRTTYEQWAQLPHVSQSDLQPGDILFFFPTSEGPSHAGIYVGNGMYIQATHPGSYVEWASLDPSSAYYGNMPYVGAARP